ncbi:MAG: SDR family oxidoreductase [Pseudomonadota bacterium]
MSLAGKVAIVSGAARGLGQACALQLQRAGCQVLGFDRDADVLKLNESTVADHPPMQALQADVSREGDVEAVVQQAISLGDIAVVVNNAGTWRRTPVSSDWAQAVADWDYIMDTNLKGVMLLSRATIPHMQQSGFGHIINISTYYVLPARSDGTNQPETDLYNASKWALNGFTDAWAKYLHKDNIKVNALCMGAVDTPMLRGFFPQQQLPADLAANVMQSEQIASLMMQVIESGRTGENVGAWVGEPVELGPQPPLHKRITG